ncbi:MAG: hypothetical protein ACKVVP_16695 [Chloroflexota bacterium]
MHLNINFLPQRRGAIAGELVAQLFGLLDDGLVEGDLGDLQVHLDWIQYKSNFREPFIVRHGIDVHGAAIPMSELAVDLRQFQDTGTRESLRQAVTHLSNGHGRESDHLWLDEFTTHSQSLIWKFNQLFWVRLADWESASGKGFEAALPGGQSDANDDAAVSDAVADFWTLLVDLDRHHQLPEQLFALEIGVGTGRRAAMWLDHFKRLDGDRGTGYYQRLHFLLGDYALATLDSAASLLDRHQSVVNTIAMDAINPMRSLSFLRYKVLSIHLTNVYDNLPADELARRDGQLYVVEVRPYLTGSAARQLSETYGIPVNELPQATRRLLEAGPSFLGHRDRGVQFWRELWEGMRLEERLRRVDGVADVPLPPGLNSYHLEDLLAEAPDDVRFQLSNGAAQSFLNTLPLLHPRGYLQVQDIFVPTMNDYREGFRGPGKMDGSVLNWVNGALLKAVAARAGYDVHFSPYHYRANSRTTILYTTPRD